MQSLDVDELTNLIAEYLLVCEVEGKSPSTLINYRRSLHRFLAHAQASEVTNARFIILNYLASLNDLKASSRNTYFRQTKALFSWALEMTLIDSNPFEGLKNIRIPETIREPFSSTDVQKMLKATSGSTDREIRDTAIIMCLIDTGLRLGELVGITYADIDFRTGRITIRKSKGGKDRVVPFASQCRLALQRYLAIRSDASGPFFWKSNPMGSLLQDSTLAPAGVRSALDRVGEKAGIANVYPHRFRHSYATWAIRSNAREVDLQHLLGHRSSGMIRRYTRTYRSEQAAERHHEFSPGNQMML